MNKRINIKSMLSLFASALALILECVPRSLKSALQLFP